MRWRAFRGGKSQVKSKMPRRMSRMQIRIAPQVDVWNELALHFRVSARPKENVRDPRMLATARRQSARRERHLRRALPQSTDRLRFA